LPLGTLLALLIAFDGLVAFVISFIVLTLKALSVGTPEPHFDSPIGRLGQRAIIVLIRAESLRAPSIYLASRLVAQMLIPLAF
jgi:hypothetical protein